MGKNKTADAKVDIKEKRTRKGNDQLKRFLIIGGCLVVALLAAFFLIQQSGYKKAEAKFQAVIAELNARLDEKDAEIIKIKDELDRAKEINVGIVREQISPIGELATAEYCYTNAGQFKKSLKFSGWDIPITQKSFILRYDGIIKAGFDITDPATQIGVDIKNNIITVTLPQPKILSHEIDFNSAEVLDERNGLFNSVSVTDVNEFYAQCKEAMDTKAKENMLLVQAGTNAKTLIESLLNANQFIRETYNIEVKTASSK